MQNFGKIKNIFNNLLIEGIVKKDDAAKKLFKKYLKLIRESEILKTQFLVYNNIENKIDTDAYSANIFVSENLKLLDKFDKARILKENNKLKALIESFGDRIDEDYQDAKLHESITSLIFTNRSASNLDKITDDIKNVTNHIVSNKEKVVSESIDMPITFLMNLMVEKYNQKYSTLENEDKEVLKALMSTDTNIKKELYNKFVSECKELVDNLLKEADTESREKLLKVREKLVTETEINEDDYILKISKIVELKNNMDK